MPKLKPGTIMPTAEEDAAIQRGVKADPDTFELSVEEFQQLRPVGRGRPRLAVTKQAIKLRLDPEVVAGFRARGKGWQSAINQALRDALGI